MDTFWGQLICIQYGKIVLAWSCRDHRTCPLLRCYMYCVLYLECPIREVTLNQFIPFILSISVPIPVPFVSSCIKDRTDISFIYGLTKRFLHRKWPLSGCYFALCV